ncbi:MAG TPA: thioredoxin family protein [Planctomycetaceae bacterium]|jgi:peroxiredoxin|nr:thioredoxin family protein [Planctomycetaceae bacterium]
MNRWVLVLAVLCLSSAPAPARAGEFNSVLNIGDPAPAWKDLPGVDGKRHSLADLHGHEIVVVVFTCNSCPIASDYEDRIIAFAKKHCALAQKTALVAINVNTVEEDLLPHMKERAAAKSFPYPYLFDESQKTGKAYGALFTPEFFVLDKDRKVTYMGAFDDNVESTKVKHAYLEPAVEATLKGAKAHPAETQASGCLIRYARSRRRKPTT